MTQTESRSSVARVSVSVASEVICSSAKPVIPQRLDPMTRLRQAGTDTATEAERAAS